MKIRESRRKNGRENFETTRWTKTPSQRRFAELTNEIPARLIEMLVRYWREQNSQIG